MPSHRSLSVSLPPGGRACDASPLSSHFLLSHSGAAPARRGGRAGTRVGSDGPGERPPARGGRGGRTWALGGGVQMVSGTRRWGVGPPPGLSALPSARPIRRHAAAHRRPPQSSGYPRGGSQPHSRPAPGQPSLPFSLSARPLRPNPVRPSSPSPAASAPAAEPHLAPRSAAPSAQLTKALTQARRGAPDSGVGSRGSLARRKLPPPPASSSLCAPGRTPPSRGLLAPPGHRAKSIPSPAFPRTRVPPLPSAACPPAALRGGLGTHSRSPSTASRCPLPAAARTPRQAGANPGCLGGCKTREVPGSNGRGAEGEQF